MFEDPSEKSRTLVEPPLQGESHLFQTLQCADWICGLVGRLTALSVSPQEYAEWDIFHKYFDARLKAVSLPCSGLEHQKLLPIPAQYAAEDIPDAPGPLAG